MLCVSAIVCRVIPGGLSDLPAVSRRRYPSADGERRDSRGRGPPFPAVAANVEERPTEAITAHAGEIQPAPLPGNAILLAGPTAVGKSDAAILLAERVGGEIISVDSMQVYRGLDIGTAKPDMTERARVAHHLIDILDVTESFDAAAFVRLTRAALEDIGRRGKVPILCGGTGLYFQALTGGLGQAPPSNPGLRSELEALPIEQLLEELAARDPVTHGSIDRANRRRVVRALEVIRLTGKPFSVLRSDWSQGGMGGGRCFF